MIVGIIAVAVAISGAMALAWLVQYRTRNASWVDAIWTFASGIGGAMYALMAFGGGAPLWRRAVIAGLALAWAARLGLYIVGRAAEGKEDPRYTALRRSWGTRYQGKMFAFLQLQALIAWLLAVAVGVAAHNPVDRVRPLDMLGVVVLVIAVAGEGVADRQLKRFRADPGNRGRICDTGLWSWSRHPNYFFEWLVWIGFLLFALDLSGRYAWGWLALIAPVMMYWLLVHVSGAAPVEQSMRQSRGAQFDRYAARVSRFFPWPPKEIAR
jgi:steroid 5-alpha reductase family enzyme